MIFDSKTRNFKPEVYENYYRQTALDQDTYLCSNAAFSDWNIHKIKVGDFAAFGNRNICAFRMEICSRFKLKNLTVYSAPGMGYYSMYSQDHHYNNIKIIRGEKPAGATQERLLSAVADGFTHRYSFTGPILENSEFSFMGDDSINISSHAHPVVKIDGNKITIVARYPDMRLDLLSKVLTPKSKVNFVDFKTWGIKSTPSILSIEKINGDDSLISQEFKNSWRLRNVKQSFFQLTLKEPLASNVKIGDGVYFPDMNGSGFIIRNNFFHDHRAVGLRLMAENGLVENNRFERIAFGAIELACSLGVWRESGWAKNIIIRNNKIKSVNEHPNKNDHLGAIATRVEYRGFIPEKFPNCHENITITNNTIEDVHGDVISIVGAKNIKITDNKIKNYNLVSSDFSGYYTHLLAGYGICLQHSSNFEIAKNIISKPGKFSKGKIGMNPPKRNQQTVEQINTLWQIKNSSPQRNILYPQFDPKGGIKLTLNGKLILDDTNGIGVLQTIPKERGLAGWGNLDWQRRTVAPTKNISKDGKTVSFSTIEDNFKIEKVCKMVSPQEFHISVSADCKIGDTFSWLANLPANVYDQAILLECDGKGYSINKINPLSPNCFRDKKILRDKMRYNIKRMIIQLTNGQKLLFTLDATLPADNTIKDSHWYLLGGSRKKSSEDFQIRNRLRYKNKEQIYNKVKLELKIKLLGFDKKQNNVKI